MKNKTSIWLGWMGFALLLIAAGCSLDRYLPIENGYYTAGDSRVSEVGHPPPWISGLDVDRQAKVVTLYLRKGDPVEVPFFVREKDAWPAGCPSNLYSQHMEVIDLQVNREEAELLGLEDPILARNCPESPPRLVLREDGEVGGSSTACPYPVSCLYFLPADTSR